MTTATRERTLEEKIDLLSEQVALISEEVALQGRRREAMSELTGDLMPLATRGMAMVSAELDEQDISLDDLKRLLFRVAASAGRLESMLAQLESISDLASDVSGLGTEAMVMLTSRLAEFDRKGYFQFMQQAFGIVDAVVENYTEDDVAALGENVVLILDTVKEMTQPDVMGLLQSTASALHEQADEVSQGNEEVPSLFGLMRQMRDPQVRLGMQRALGMLRTISGPQPTGTTTKERN